MQIKAIQTEKVFGSPTSQAYSQLNQARLQTQSAWSLDNSFLGTEQLSITPEIKFICQKNQERMTNFQQQSFKISSIRGRKINDENTMDNLFNSFCKASNRHNIFFSSQSNIQKSELNNARIQDSVCSSAQGSRTPESKIIKDYKKKKQIFMQKKKTQLLNVNFQKELGQLISEDIKEKQSPPYQLMTPTRPTQPKNCTQGIQKNSKTLTAKIRRRNDLSIIDLCPICLGQFANPRAKLQCKHQFCYECLQAWSKSSSNCPCCRFQFDRIIKLKIKQQLGKKSEMNKLSIKRQNIEYEEQQVMIQKKQYQFDIDEYYTCYVCFRGDNEHVLFICDQCDFYSCHIYCDERLDGVIPEGDWFCRHCCERNPELEREMLEELQNSNLRYQPNQLQQDSQQEQQSHQSHVNESVNSLFYRFDQNNPRLYIQDSDLTSLQSESQVQESHAPIAQRTRRATTNNNLEGNWRGRAQGRSMRANQQANMRVNTRRSGRLNARMQQQEEARGTAMRLRVLRRRI